MPCCAFSSAGFKGIGTVWRGRGGLSVLLCVRRKRDVAPGIKQTEIGTEAVVDVAPLAGRLVLFLSGAVEHAVLPNFSQRVALTAWCQ